MPVKLSRKTFPSGKDASEFTYQGRPAENQDDFGEEVGLADMVCVDQFGEKNSSKYYHGGVVVDGSGAWWVYLEWGRVRAGQSWAGGRFCGADYQFVQCSGEVDARKFFQKQMRSKNIRRLEKRIIAGREMWAGRKGKDGYLVQRLARRERGLPDATKIVEVVTALPSKTSPKKTETSQDVQAAKLARDLVGGTQDYTRALAEASGVVPTMAAIEEVREELIPAALMCLKRLGTDEAAWLSDKDLRELSKYTASIVPRPIPRRGDPLAILMTPTTIPIIQMDLDAFEASLQTGVEVERKVEVPSLGRSVRWLGPGTDRRKEVESWFRSMTNNRHSDIQRGIDILNVFEVSSHSRTQEFVSEAERLSKARRAANNIIPPELQPPNRGDADYVRNWAEGAGLFFGIHGTRGVNVAPILKSNLRLPKSLRGVHITGAAFGSGIYFADDFAKAASYAQLVNRYGGGTSRVKGRGAFMFLCDVISGKQHYPRSAWKIDTVVPEGADSVYAHTSLCRSLQNNEYVIFNPAHQLIRYVVELELRGP